MTSINTLGSNSSIQLFSQVSQRNGMQPPPPHLMAKVKAKTVAVY